MDISTGWLKSDIHTWIYSWIYPWISISTASLVLIAVHFWKKIRKNQISGVGIKTFSIHNRLYRKFLQLSVGIRSKIVSKNCKVPPARLYFSTHDAAAPMLWVYSKTSCIRVNGFEPIYPFTRRPVSASRQFLSSTRRPKLRSGR